MNHIQYVAHTCRPQPHLICNTLPATHINYPKSHPWPGASSWCFHVSTFRSTSTFDVWRHFNAATWFHSFLSPVFFCVPSSSVFTHLHPYPSPYEQRLAEHHRGESPGAKKLWSEEWCVFVVIVQLAYTLLNILFWWTGVWCIFWNILYMKLLITYNRFKLNKILSYCVHTGGILLIDFQMIIHVICIH